MIEKLDVPQQIFDKANLYFKKDDYENYINQIIKLHSLIQCSCFFRHQDKTIFEEQADYINSTNFDTPNWAENFSKGFIYLKNKEEMLAYHYFTKAIDLKEHPLLYSLRSCISSKENPTPIEDALLAVKQDPSPRNHFICASNYSDLNNIEGAAKNKEHLTQAINLAPDFSCAYNNRANQYASDKNFNKAILDYKSCLKYQPDHWAYRPLIKYLLKENRISEALYYADLGYKNSNDQEFYLLKKTDILISIEKFDDAIMELQKFNKENSENYKILSEIEKTITKKLDYYLNKAEKLYKENNFSEALIYYELYRQKGKPLLLENINHYLNSLIRLNNKTFDLEKRLNQYKTTTEELRPKEYQSWEKFNFGKYQGKEIDQIMKLNSGYILWCVVNLDHFACPNIWFLQPSFRNDPLFYTALEKNIIKQKLIPPRPKFNTYNTDYYQEPNPLNSEFYNDSLDMDQQSPEFWDSI